MTNESKLITDSTKIVLVSSDVPSKKPKKIAIPSDDAVVTQPRIRDTSNQIREFSDADKLAASLAAKIGTLSKEEVQEHHDLEPATVVALTS